MFTEEKVLFYIFLISTSEKTKTDGTNKRSHFTGCRPSIPLKVTTNKCGSAATSILCYEFRCVHELHVTTRSHMTGSPAAAHLNNSTWMQRTSEPSCNVVTVKRMNTSFSVASQGDGGDEGGGRGMRKLCSHPGTSRVKVTP